MTSSFELHHNFPKLAEESGFTFNTHKPRVRIEWNKIKLIDIDSIIKDKKFVLLEQHINDILGCVLESEFDVRILDEGVLKIFRLSQLAVEYQQFCRNYLDRSIYILREEVTNLLKDVETTRRSLREKDEEIRKLKRKNKHSMRTPLPYGNENIATMLLKTLNNTKGDIFNSSSHTDVLQYNKCNYCEKIFLNQLYLKSHISRRHPEFLEIPQKDVSEKIIPNENTNTKLNEEIEELKTKLKQMEDLITNTRAQDKSNDNLDQSDKNKIQNIETNCKTSNVVKEMKDAEVLTDEDRKIEEKIENWKREEYEKYNQEIALLRKQIVEIVSNKEKQEQSSTENDLKMMEQLQATIKQQSSEIIALKNELLNSEIKENEKRKEIENQMTYWIKQAEKQSNEYKELLQKLNEVTNEARECRARAEAEKEKSSKLQEILEQHLNRSPPKQSKPINYNKNVENTDEINTNHEKTVKTSPKAATVDFLTLSKLQQKAHELLSMNDISTCESSSVSDEKIKPNKIKVSEFTDDKPHKYSSQKQNEEKSQQKSKKEVTKINKTKNKSDKKPKSKLKSGKHATPKMENGYAHIPNSPIKVVRAKITEEVNQRLISLGVDPLRNRLPQNTFQKQRTLLQKEQDIKAKKFPVREKILHSIMAHLDETTSNKNVFQRNDYISPNKSPKTFSLSSVLTNVKTKALSLVKSSESINKTNKSYNDIAKRAMAILKTPPDSANSSPKIQRQNAFVSPEKMTGKVSKSRKNVKYQLSKPLLQDKKTESSQENDTSDDTTSKSFDQELTNKPTTTKAVKSPVRHPADLSVKQNVLEHSLFAKRDDKTNSKIDDLYETKAEVIDVAKKSFFGNKDDSSDDVESIVDSSPRKFFSEENISNLKQTKGVLKNASSTSSLNKKKVIFDMDAIQMKSVSASPSQSITEKSDDNEKNKYGVVNLETDEWDISSIENDQPTSTVKVQITSHTSPKIAELKKSIESQLTRRNPSLSTALVGGVDVLTAPIQKATSFGGSNTSLGSSILDDTDSVPIQNKTLIKPRHVEKDDSEIEISDLINDAVNDNKNYVKSY